MKISVEFPSVAYREGPAQVVDLAKAIEAIGYDDLAVFDHVVMGYATESRRAPMYPSQMPILEALVTLGFVAAVTERVTLSTEVLVLPQRQAVLVAKQVSTLDTLSGGRLRLGVGVGWQEVEYQALGEDFAGRGRRMDEAIDLLRACWGEERIERAGRALPRRCDRDGAEAAAAATRLPIWIGGDGPAALRRTGRLRRRVDGLGHRRRRPTSAAPSTEIRRHAEEAGRDPMAIGLQAMLAPPPRDAGGKTFYQDHDRVVRPGRADRGLGFGWIARERHGHLPVRRPQRRRR